MSANAPIVGPWVGAEPLASQDGLETWLVNGEEHPFGVLKIARGPDDRVLLRREAQILKRAEHPRLPRLLDADTGGDWLVHDHVEGTPLSAAIGRLTLREAVDVGSVLAMVLAHLHSLDIIHGDLHPDNVLLDRRGVPRLVGLARAWTQQDDVRHAGHPGHAAPEQVRGGRPTPAADVYALGVLLYLMVTGLMPYRSTDPAALSYLPLTSLPEPPSALRTDLPELLNDLILRAMAREPAQRPGPSRQLARRLRHSLGSRPARPVVGMQQEREILRRMVALAANGHPEVVVLHGPRGCGRTTLIREALTAARRQGLQVVPVAEGPVALAPGGPPSVIALDGNRPDHVELVGRILGDDLPWLVLVRADRPLPSLVALGSRQVEPTRLDREAISVLLEHYQQPPDEAEALLAATEGLPERVRASIQQALHPNRTLSRLQRRLMDAVATGPVRLPDLAARLGVREHELLDLAEPLIDRGQLQELDGGEALGPPLSPGRPGRLPGSR